MRKASDVNAAAKAETGKARTHGPATAGPRRAAIHPRQQRRALHRRAETEGPTGKPNTARPDGKGRRGAGRPPRKSLRSGSAANSGGSEKRTGTGGEQRQCGKPPELEHVKLQPRRARP